MNDDDDELFFKENFSTFSMNNRYEANEQDSKIFSIYRSIDD